MEDVALGQDMYLRYGASPLKTNTILDPANLFYKAALSNRYHHLQNPGVTLNATLTCIMRTSKYFPSGYWVVPVKGQGWDAERAEVLWNMLLNPQETQLKDVDMVFSRQG